MVNTLVSLVLVTLITLSMVIVWPSVNTYTDTKKILLEFVVCFFFATFSIGYDDEDDDDADDDLLQSYFIVLAWTVRRDDVNSKYETSAFA